MTQPVRTISDISCQMLDTATAVYEAVEPIIIWRALFASLQTQETGPATVRRACDTVYSLPLTTSSLRN